MPCPRHALFDGEIGQLPALQRGDRDVGDLVNLLLERLLVTNTRALQSEKLNGMRRQELLQRPSTRKPPALSECWLPGRLRQLANMFGTTSGHIRHIHIASGGFLVPPKHGVYSLGQLGAVRLIDAARVDPKVGESIGGGLAHTELDFTVARLFGP